MDRYPSGPCRPCSSARGVQSAQYFAERHRRIQQAKIDVARDDPTLTGSIYALRDPTDGRIRYVGQTRQSLNRRLSGHLRRPRDKEPHLPVNRWIARLVAAGLQPKIELLEEGIHVVDLDEAERRHIGQMRAAAGANLLNICVGGRSPLLSWGMPEEAIRRSAAAKRGKPRSPETKRKLSEANKGKKADPAVVEARAAAMRGRKQTPEHVAARVAAIQAKRVPALACRAGHEYTAENTRWYRGNRHCRACARAHSLRGYYKAKARAEGVKSN